MNSLLRTVPSLWMRKSKITKIFDGNYSLNYAELKLTIPFDKKFSKYKGFALLQICINQSQHFKGWKTSNWQKTLTPFFHPTVMKHFLGLLVVAFVLQLCTEATPHPSWTEVSFLVLTMTKTTCGSYSRSRRLRKMHLENILPRASWDRDPRYPMGVPWDQNFFLKKILSKSYLGICRQV